MSDEERGSETPPGSRRRPPTIDGTATPIEPDAGPAPGRRYWALLGAAACGAVAVLLAIGALWYNGLLADYVTVAGDDAARFTRIETQLRELSARPAPAADLKPLEDITARLAKIEAATTAARSADPALAARLGAAESAAKSAGDEVAALRGRIDEIAATARSAQTRADAADAAQKANSGSANIGALEARIASLEAAIKDIDSESGKQNSGAANDRASRLAVAAAALSSAVERGDAFAAELAAAKNFSDAKTLAVLEPFASSGVPSAASLARELTALIPAIGKAAPAKVGENGILEKLQANAERIIRIRPVGDQAGDDTAAIVARIEAKAARDDIAGAMAELSKLPASMRAPAGPWIGKAEKREAAIAASRQFMRDALTALGKSAS